MIDLLPEPLRALAAQIEGVIYVAQNDDARTPIAVGPSAELVLGYTAEELCSEPELLLAHVHPEDIARLRAELRAARNTPYLPLKYRFVHKSGRVIWCRETQVLNLETGVVAGVTVDVTELELPQRALQAALSVTDSRGVALSICEAAAQSLGLAWTLYLDARTEARLFNQHGPLGAVESSAWSEAPMEPWARAVETTLSLDWVEDGAGERLSPELRAACPGARFGFAIRVVPESEGGPGGVLLGLATRAYRPPVTYRRALEQLVRQGALALQRAELVDALRRTGRERQQLADALLRAHEAERGRLARELHDGAGQTLTAVAIQLDLAEQLSPPSGRAPLVRARQQIERTLEELRRLSHALRPAALDDLGLADALAEMAHAMQTQAFSVRVEAASPLPPLPSELATGLFRIAQAALTNVVRHANATRATLRLRLDGAPGATGLLLELEDDGHGFAPAEPRGAPGIGLIAMRERALALGGRFTMQSRPGRGTLVTVWAPLS